MQILKIIALLIEYPDETLWENREEALSLIEQDLPALLPFARQHLDAALLDKQAEWCEVFERGRAPSLLLFEHVHAESRDRGQAMVDLMSQYEKAGLQLDCRELPDYLPLYLEYLSLVTDDEAREGLQRCADPGADWRSPEAARRGALSAVRCAPDARRHASDQRQRGETGFHRETG